jgi:hypothetical protein
MGCGTQTEKDMKMSNKVSVSNRMKEAPSVFALLDAANLCCSILLKHLRNVSWLTTTSALDEKASPKQHVQDGVWQA